MGDTTCSVKGVLIEVQRPLLDIHEKYVSLMNVNNIIFVLYIFVYVIQKVFSKIYTVKKNFFVIVCVFPDFVYLSLQT